MSDAKSAAIDQVMTAGPVIPVVIVKDAASAVPLALALAKGGIRVIEVTLRTPAALEAIRAIAAEVEGVVVGAGTVLTPDQFDAAYEAGARFAVSPGATARLLDAAEGHELALLPGAQTVSESMALVDRGLVRQKFFPAAAAGGVGYLASLVSPLPQAVFCPTGGVTPDNAPDYLALANVGCVGGSWVTPPALIAAGEWDRIAQLAREAAALEARAR